MKILLLLLSIFMLFPQTLNARTKSIAKKVSYNDSIVAAYTDSLQQALFQTVLAPADSNETQVEKTPSPYYFPLFCGGTLYSTALRQDMGYEGHPSTNSGTETWNQESDDTLIVRRKKTLPSLGDKTDSYLLLNSAINANLNIAYVNNPSVFSRTDLSLEAAGEIHTDLEKHVKEDVKLAEKEELPDVPEVVINSVTPIAKKPNFWSCKGNGSLQFSQNFYTENWYQGGSKTYSMLVALNLEANYNDKRKVQWDNKLEVQLGFQTDENSKPTFRATTDLLRLTTKFGYKMAKNWNYAGRVIMESQPFPIYDSKGENITSTFASPLYVKTSVGLDWKLSFKNFNSSLYLAPIEHNLTYVYREEIRSRYGIEEGKSTKSVWGPNITFTFTWNIWKNISWTSRTYWFSNFEMTRIECENTFNFTINKYLSAKLFLYPRFDDSSSKYYSEENNFFMFKEWLSLGVNVNF